MKNSPSVDLGTWLGIRPNSREFGHRWKSDAKNGKRVVKLLKDGWSRRWCGHTEIHSLITPVAIWWWLVPMRSPPTTTIPTHERFIWLVVNNNKKLFLFFMLCVAYRRFCPIHSYNFYFFLPLSEYIYGHGFERFFFYIQYFQRSCFGCWGWWWYRVFLQMVDVIEMWLWHVYWIMLDLKPRLHASFQR